MFPKSKNLNLILLCCALIGAITFFGCGGNTSSDPLPAGPPAPLQIVGRITSSAVFGSMRGSTFDDEMPLDLRAAISEGKVEVYLESHRNEHTTYANDDGEFVLENVPEGSHHVVAVITTTANLTYKVRSKTISVTRSEPTTEAVDLELQKAEAIVEGIFRDADGKPVPNVLLKLWGHPFRTSSSGEFTTPPMPTGINAVIQSEIVGYQQTEITMEFDENVTPFIEQTVVKTGATNRAPTVFLKAASASMEVSTQDKINLTAVASDLDNDQLKYKWIWTQGELATSSELKATWTAPEYDANAKITVTASDGKLTATASIDVKVGRGGSSARPPKIRSVTVTRVKDAQLATNSELLDDMEYKFVAVATDTAGGDLIYTWKINSESELLHSVSSSTAIWRTPVLESEEDLPITVKLIVENNLGGKEEDKKTWTVKKNPSPPAYTSPYVIISSPTNGSLVLPGSMVEYSGLAIDNYDKEIDKSKFLWSQKKYDGVSYNLTSADFASGTDRIATHTSDFFKESNTDSGVYAVLLEVVDDNSVKGEKIIYYRVNSKPTAEITGPTAGAITGPGGLPCFQLGESITFTGTGNDIEDDTATLTWTFPSGEPVIEVAKTQTTVPRDDLLGGKHEVSLQASDRLGAKSEIATISVYVNTPPKIDILTPSPGANILFGQPATLSASITDPDEEIASASILWFNGETELGSGYQLVVTSLLAGEQEISLKVSDTMGGTDTKVVSITVHELPTMTIDKPANGNSILAGNILKFEGKGKDVFDNVIPAENYVWYYQIEGGSRKDLATGKESFESSLLDTPGEYDIILEGSVLDGDETIASETSVKINIVQNSVEIQKPVTMSGYHHDTSINFKADAPAEGSGITIEWLASGEEYDGTTIGESDISDGMLDKRDFNFSFAGLSEGIYDIKCLVTDSDGNVASDSIKIQIRDLPVIDSFSYNPDKKGTIEEKGDAPVFIFNDGEAKQITITANTLGTPSDMIYWSGVNESGNPVSGNVAAFARGIGKHEVEISVHDPDNSSFDHEANTTETILIYVWEEKDICKYNVAPLNGTVGCVDIFGSDKELYLTLYDSNTPPSPFVRKVEYAGDADLYFGTGNTTEFALASTTTVPPFDFTVASSSTMIDFTMYFLGSGTVNTQVATQALCMYNTDAEPQNGSIDLSTILGDSHVYSISSHNELLYLTHSAGITVLNPENTFNSVSTKSFGVSSKLIRGRFNDSSLYYVADSNNSRIDVLTTGLGVDSSINTPDDHHPVDIAFSGNYVFSLGTDGKILLFSNTTQEKIMEIGKYPDATSIYSHNGNLFVAYETGIRVICSGLPAWLD